MESNNLEPQSIAIPGKPKVAEKPYLVKNFDSMESLETKISVVSNKTELTFVSFPEADEHAKEEHMKSPYWLNALENTEINFNAVNLSAKKEGEDLRKPPKHSEEFCRICHCGSEDEALISPCNCSGSAMYVHQKCLLSWFEVQKDQTCELCLYEVKVKRRGFKPLPQWKFPWRSCDIVSYLFVLYCLVLVVFIAMVLWIASRRCLSPICIVLYLACGLGVSYFSYCCGCIGHTQYYWKNWTEMNRKWLVLPREGIEKSSSDPLRFKNKREFCKRFPDVV